MTTGRHLQVQEGTAPKEAPQDGDRDQGIFLVNLYLILASTLIAAIVFALLIDRIVYGNWYWEKRR